MAGENALTHTDLAIGEVRQAIELLEHLDSREASYFQGYVGSSALRELRDTLPKLDKARARLLAALSAKGGKA